MAGLLTTIYAGVVKTAAIRNQEPAPMEGRAPIGHALPFKSNQLPNWSKHPFALKVFTDSKKRLRRFNIRLSRSSLRGQPSEFV